MKRCETCVAVRECTGDRAARCTWCKAGLPAWRGTATERAVVARLGAARFGRGRRKARAA